LLEDVRKQQKLADVVIVDGNGLLHPRFAGIASHVGVLAGVRTIGIGKKLLCGRSNLEGMKADDPRPVLYHDRLVGMAWKATSTSRPIFVSPGHLIDVAGAMRVVRRLGFGHRVPEPNYLADALSRRTARSRKVTGSS
jgi:deoxyribonuclease V